MSCEKTNKKNSLRGEELRKHQGIIVLLTESKDALNIGDFKLALVLVDSALQYADDMAVIYFLKGRIYEKINRSGEIIKSNERYIDVETPADTDFNFYQLPHLL